MAASAGPNLGLTYGYAAHDSGWGVNGFNPDFAMLDALVFLGVISHTLGTPPGSPATGDRYIIGTGTGAWSGQDKAVTIWDGSAWVFYPPKEGWKAYNLTLDLDLKYNGSSWVALAPVLEVPTAAGTGFSAWINQGGSSVADSAAGITITRPTGGGNDVWTYRRKTAPSTPYVITALLSLTTKDPGAINQIGLGWYDGTNKVHVARAILNSTAVPYIYVSQYSTPTAFNGHDFSNVQCNYPVWLRIADDGTNISFQYSNDGVNFVVLYTAAKSGAYLGSGGYTNIVFGIAMASTTGYCTLMSYHES